MALHYQYVMVFYISYNSHVIIHFCGKITFRNICLKLKNIFGPSNFMVYAKEKASMTLVRGIISLFRLVL